MVQFTDLFIAYDDKEACSHDIYSQASSHGITENDLLILWACLEQTKLKKHHELIFIELESEEILYKLPALLVKLIANITEDSLSNIAIQWAEHEEIQCSYEKAKEKLGILIELARETQLKKYSLYLVMV